MANYYRRPWNEVRGDDQNAWGPSVWFFEVDANGSVLRQVEQYEKGPTLGYGVDLTEDAWGGLASSALDLAEFEPYEIIAAEFEAAWAQVQRPPPSPHQ
ncbi:MAG TPA: hypothetical protein VGW38_22720 [Chloroflexota bacterium]|nr:hypothetical protein [Chloroflexota bacterium]